jgi:hypothetical protein
MTFSKRAEKTGTGSRIRTTEFKYFPFFFLPFVTYNTLIHCYSLDDGLHVENLHDRCRVCVQAFRVRVHTLEKFRILQLIKLRFVCKENRKHFKAYLKNNNYSGMRKKKSRKSCTVLFKSECHKGGSKDRRMLQNIQFTVACLGRYVANLTQPISSFK